jgi:hypothetical protein
MVPEGDMQRREPADIPRSAARPTGPFERPPSSAIHDAILSKARVWGNNPAVIYGQLRTRFTDLTMAHVNFVLRERAGADADRRGGPAR